MMTTTALLLTSGLVAGAPATAGATSGAPATAAAAPTAAASCGGRTATLVGTAGRDVLRGTSGPDVIVARGGNDLVDGRGGDDLVCAGRGADEVLGGSGDDRLRGGLDFLHFVQEEGWYVAGDTLRGGPGDDALDAGVDSRNGKAVRTRRDTVSWSTATRGITLDLAAGTAVGQGADTVVAGRLEVRLTAFDDEVQGSGRSEFVRTGAGADVVQAGAGDDAVLVDDGEDTSDDQVTGGRGDDVLAGHGGANTLVGGRGDDQLSDRGPDDTLRGGRGRDQVIHAMAYTSGLVLAGGLGRDSLEVATAAAHDDDVARTVVDLTLGTFVHTPDGEEAVTHTVPGFEVVDLDHFDEVDLTGTDGRNRLFVDADDITVHALGGDDALYPCCDGGDHLDGGPGHDRLPFQSCTANTCVSIEESAE